MSAFMQRRIAEPIDGGQGPFMRVYLDAAQAEGQAPATVYEKWRELSWFAVADGIADKLPDEVETFDIERYLSMRYRNRDGGGMVSPSTRKKVLAILSGYFTYLQDRNVVSRNPCRAIRRPSIPEPEPSWWTGEEVTAILKAPGQPRDRLLLMTLARTGQRVGVVRTLRWSDLSLDSKEPVISFKRGKGGRVHTFPIDNVLLREFILYRALARPEGDGPVFLSRKGGSLSSEQVNRIIAAACVKAGVRVASAHEFRRSAITNLLHAGVPLDVVSRDIAGHASPATTIRHYRGTQSARVREAKRGLPYG